jgi:hypothetical protein
VAFISHVDDERVSSPKQFHAAVEGKRGEVRVRLTTGRGAEALRTIAP